MPREQINIVKFDSGIISNPDQEDITNEAPVASLNIDPNSEDGKLRSVETSGAAYTANGTAIPDVRIGEFIQQGTQYDLIYHDASDNHISAVTNFHAAQASRTLSDLVTSNVSDETSIVVNNSEVHIGTGNGSANVPKWIGYVEYALFNGFTENDYFIFTGGTDDMTGDFSGLTDVGNVFFEIEITASGTPDVFRWRKNGGAWTSGVNITGSAQTLSDGVTITFGGTNTHAPGDKWYMAKYQVPSGLQTYNDKLSPPSTEIELVLTPSAGTGTKYFKTTKIYEWGVSYTYDGYQESPITVMGDDTPGADAEYYSVIFRVPNAVIQTTLSTRISTINLYRRETEDLSVDSYGLWKKVYSLDDDVWSVRTTVPEDLTITVTDRGLGARISTGDLVPLGTTYEEETGISSTLEDTIVNYALSCKGDGYLFVGKCYHPSIPDAEKYIFRSKGKRFSMFDWSKDFVILPAVPTAMAYYNSRLFVFTINKIYRINPFDLVPEDEYEGMGAKGQRAARLTPYGLYFANDNGAYVMEGQTVTELSMQIKNASSASGLSWGNTIAKTTGGTIFTDFIILYEANKKCVLFIGSINSTTDQTRVWAYHIPKRRWDYWNLGSIVVDANSGAFNGKDGEIYLSNASNLFELFAGASRENWEWISKEFNLNEPQLKKMWHYIDRDSSGSGTVIPTFGYEGSTPTTAITGTREIKVSGNWLTAKSLQVKIVGTSTDELDSLIITLRKLIGYR